MRKSPWGRFARKLVPSARKGDSVPLNKKKHSLTPRVEELENRLVPVAPVVSSILRTTPSAAFTNATSVAYTVTFDQPVTGVDATDFNVMADVALRFNPTLAVGGSGAVYTVSINGLAGTGSLRLDLIDNDSIQGAGLPLGGPGVANGSFQGQAYSVSLNASGIVPSVASINRLAPSIQAMNSASLTFSVAFSEPVTGVDVADFKVALTGSATGVVSQVVPTGPASYTVTVTGAGGLGNVGLNFVIPRF
jgi:hypothetical protein